MAPGASHRTPGRRQRALEREVSAMPALPAPERMANGCATQLRAVLQRFAGVRLALLFGSTGLHASDASDVDVAVSAPPEDLLALASGLSEACGREVDAVSLRIRATPLLEELLRDGQPTRASPGLRDLALARAHDPDIDGPAYARMRDAWPCRATRRRWSTKPPRAKWTELAERLAQVRTQAQCRRTEARRCYRASPSISMLAIQACADVANHLIADEGWAAPRTTAEAFCAPCRTRRDSPQLALARSSLSAFATSSCTATPASISVRCIGPPTAVSTTSTPLLGP